MTRIQQIDRDRIVHDEPITTYRWAELLSDFISYALGVLEFLLAFRFVFLLFGTSNTYSFVNTIYTLTKPLVSPFQSIFVLPHADVAVFDWATILAMVVYAALAYFIIQLLNPDHIVDEADMV